MHISLPMQILQETAGSVNRWGQTHRTYLHRMLGQTPEHDVTNKAVRC